MKDVPLGTPPFGWMGGVLAQKLKSWLITRDTRTNRGSISEAEPKGGETVWSDVNRARGIT